MRKTITHSLHSNNRKIAKPVVATLTIFFLNIQPSLGDQYHYKNFIIGDRAIGLGGAYTAISDDASGIFYNPAGTAFAQNSDISGSANAFYNSKIIYRGAVSGNDFVEESTGTVPSFFGGLQKLDKILPGFVLSFGIYLNNNDYKDQNDFMLNINRGVPTPQCTPGVNRNPIILERFHRTANERAYTFNASMGLAYRVRPKFAVGVGLNYVNVDELTQEYQDARNLTNVCQSGTMNEQVTLTTQNARQRLIAYGLQPILSLQALLTEKLSWGLTFKYTQFLSQAYQIDSESRFTQVAKDSQQSIDDANGSGVLVSSLLAQVNGNVHSTNPLGRSSFVISNGLAYFYSPKLLFSLDVDYFSASKDAEDILHIGNLYRRNTVINYSLGTEYYVLSSLPLRFAFFTNNDARPKLNSNQSGQADHIDYNGGSLFLSWVQPNSQLGAGVVYQQGRGEAQKIAGSTAIQRVDAKSVTLVISATHSL